MSTVRNLVHAVGGPFVVLFALRLLVFTIIERRWPAYRVSLRRVFLGDLTTTLFLIFVTYPAAGLVVRQLPLPSSLPAALTAWPVGVRFLLYVLLADLGHYWVHRLMHRPLLWRIHKWHHTPDHMSWLAGNRQSFLDRLLVGLPYTLLFPLLDLSPVWLMFGLSFLNILKNDWTHLNVTWRLRWLEWLIITPRLHHIHHSADPAHYTSNLGPLFSVWDRLFGTYRAPEPPGKLAFGTGERVPLPRLMIGL